MRELGKIQRGDPELYLFMYEAFSEKQRRIQAELEKARSQ